MWNKIWSSLIGGFSFCVVAFPSAGQTVMSSYWTWSGTRGGPRRWGGGATQFSSLPRNSSWSRTNGSSSSSLNAAVRFLRAPKMAALARDAINSVWHAFDSLDDNRNGQVPKSRLKVLTANLGAALGCLDAEKGLDDHRSTSYLRFDDYIYYLHKELFAAVPTPCDSRERAKALARVDDVCWLVCHKKYQSRVPVLLPERSLFRLFRVFCVLAHTQTQTQSGQTEAQGVTQVVLPAEEAEYVARSFVLALGKEWDGWDFQQIAEKVPTFKFNVLVALLENSYAKGADVHGLSEATLDVYDTVVEDVIKKGTLARRGLLSIWKESWFVLQPLGLTCYTDRSEKERRGEIRFNPKCTIQTVPDSPSLRGSKFTVTSADKVFEFVAPDYKTKLQWVIAIQTAIEHSDNKESYQKRLSLRRKAEREAARARRLEEERHLLQQRDVLERQRVELETERAARAAAESRAREEASLREREVQRFQEVEEAKRELERLLEEERMAKKDEEIVRNLQARVLREEWEKREELERLQAEQSGLLEEERTKRVGLELEQQNKEKQLEDARTSLKQLMEEKRRLDTQLTEARERMVLAESAKEVLEAKLHVRERSQIPVPVRFTRPRSSDSVPDAPKTGRKISEPANVGRRTAESVKAEGEVRCTLTS